MMQQRERANGICRSVEDQFRPLSTARVLERNYVHAAAIEQGGKLFDKLVRRVGGLEGTDPGVAADVKADVAGFNKVSSRKRSAANHVRNVLRKNFFIANAVLH